MSSAGKVHISWRHQQTNDIFFCPVGSFLYKNTLSNQKGKPQTQTETEGKMHDNNKKKRQRKKKLTSDLCTSNIRPSSITFTFSPSNRLFQRTCRVVNNLVVVMQKLRSAYMRQPQFKLPNRNLRSLDPIYIQSAPYSTHFFFFSKIISSEKVKSPSNGSKKRNKFYWFLCKTQILCHFHMKHSAAIFE